jgi:hypothetical protein
LVIFICVITDSYALEPRKKIGLDVGLSTVVPVSTGVLIEYRAHKYCHVGLDIGYMPPPYIDLINTINESLGVYTESTSEVIRNSLQNSLVISPQVKAFPIKSVPFYVSAAYTLLSLGGGFNTLDTLSVVFPDFAESGVFAFQNSSAFNTDIPVTTILHSAKVAAGIKYTARTNIYVNAELAFFKAFYSSTSVTDSNLTTLESELDYYMNDLYVTYITIPVIGLAIGYSF